MWQAISVIISNVWISELFIVNRQTTFSCIRFFTPTSIFLFFTTTLKPNQIIQYFPFWWWWWYYFENVDQIDCDLIIRRRGNSEAPDIIIIIIIIVIIILLYNYTNFLSHQHGVLLLRGYSWYGRCSLFVLGPYRWCDVVSSQRRTHRYIVAFCFENENFHINEWMTPPKVNKYAEWIERPYLEKGRKFQFLISFERDNILHYLS